MKSDLHGYGHKNRCDFLTQFMNSLRVKLGISNREFIWVACEEFGFTEAGHLHVMFSFDYLKEKERMEKLKITDFAEDGKFWREGKESINYISKTLRIDPNKVNFHWQPTWENKSLFVISPKKSAIVRRRSLNSPTT